jgi:hypothetical protein
MPNYFPENNAALATDSLERSMAKVVGGLPPALDFMFGSFYRNFADKKTLNHGIGPAINFTRASNATFFDANGTLQTAANDTPRFDHDPATGASRGLLIEEARTNSIRNSQAGGAVVGAPGTLPTNWGTIGITGGADVSQEIVATGTEAGMSYVDLRFYGTASASFFVGFDTATGIVAANGQTWTGSVYVKLVGGSMSNIGNVRVQVRANNVSGSVLQTGTTTFTPSSSLARNAHTLVFNNASIARTRTGLAFFDTIGAIDITLRIAAPQLEQGAFATSYIPTTNAAATRAADSAVVTPISSFYNAVESTILSESSAFSVAADTTVLAINNTTQNEQIDHRYAVTGLNTRVRVAGVNQAAFTSGSAPVSGTVYKLAGAYTQNDFAFSVNGSAASTDSLGDMPTGLFQMEIGRRAGSAIITGHIRKIAYWPRRLSNALLQQLTT